MRSVCVFCLKGSQEAIYNIKTLRISHNCGEFIHNLTTKNKFNLVKKSIALIAGSNVKAITGLWIYSVANSVGKSTFTNLLARVVSAFKYCMNDNLWQESFNIDSREPYQLLIVDGLMLNSQLPLSLIEHIPTTKIAMKRRGKEPGYMR